MNEVGARRFLDFLLHARWTSLVPEQQGVAAGILVEQALPEVELIAGEVGPTLGLRLLGAGSPRGKIQLPRVFGQLLRERLLFFRHVRQGSAGDASVEPDCTKMTSKGFRRILLPDTLVTYRRYGRTD